MEVSLSDLSSNPFSNLIQILIQIIRFVFLTPVGWVFLFIGFLAILIRNIKDHDGKITFGSFLAGISSTLFAFLSQGSNLILSVVILLGLSGLLEFGGQVQRSFELWNQASRLQATVKNLKSERLIVEAEIHRADTQLQATLRFYSWSPVSEKNTLTKEISYTLKGNRIYLDFGVINFSHSLVENGDSVNLAFPNRLYSDTIAPSNGIDLLQSKGRVPPTFKIDKNDLFILSEKEYQQNIQWIFNAATNRTRARKIGIKTTYGQAFALLPNEKNIYRFYATATGGMIQKRK